MKPKIGDKVYIIIDNSISEEQVGYLGADSFVVDLYNYVEHSCFDYNDYNKVWFRSLDKAKTELRKRFGRKANIQQIGSFWWEVVEDEEN